MKSLLTIILAVLANTALAQPFEEWVARYNGSTNGADIAEALAVDAEGNVYVTGYSYNEQHNEDYATIKYDPEGNELWVARYNGPGNTTDYALALALDSNGNVYVTGYSEGSGTDWDYATTKYDSNGDQLWVARYNGPGNYIDKAYALAVDGSGNVCVTGISRGYGTHYDYATIKYDSNGNELWVARYNGPENGRDGAKAMAVDAQGNVYVTGYSWGGDEPDEDYLTIKYDRNGNQLWARRYNGPRNSADMAVALALDRSGNVCVTGYSPGSGTREDYATIKYDCNGGQLWVARYNGTGNDYDWAKALTVDLWSNVYVTGYSKGAGSDLDYATIKYDSHGNELWVARYNGPGNGFDRGNAIAVDAEGNVYVTGDSYGSGTDYDYATIKYDSDGNQLWDPPARYNGPGNGADWAGSLALDATGYVYVAGASEGSGTDYDYATIKYSQTNLPVAKLNVSTTSRGTPITASLDPSASYDPNGNIVLYEFDREGDGIYDRQNTNGAPVSFTYEAPGGWRPTLRVTDNDGSIDIASSDLALTSYRYDFDNYSFDNPGLLEWLSPAWIQAFCEYYASWAFCRFLRSSMGLCAGMACTNSNYLSETTPFPSGYTYVHEISEYNSTARNNVIHQHVMLNWDNWQRGYPNEEIALNNDIHFGQGLSLATSLLTEEIGPVANFWWEPDRAHAVVAFGLIHNPSVDSTYYLVNDSNYPAYLSRLAISGRGMERTCVPQTYNPWPGVWVTPYSGTIGWLNIADPRPYDVEAPEPLFAALQEPLPKSGNTPNPFNSSTTIYYTVAEPAAVKLRVFNVLGQRVATLVDQKQEAGQHSVIWDASGQASGVYFYKLSAGDFTETRRMTLLR